MVQGFKTGRGVVVGPAFPASRVCLGFENSLNLNIGFGKPHFGFK